MDTEDPIDWDAVELNIEETSSFEEELPPDFLRPIGTIHNLNSKVYEFLCFLCGKSYCVKEDLLVHLTTDHTGRHCHCHFCPARFTSIVFYVEHLFISHTAPHRNYKCKKCEVVGSLWTSTSPYLAILHRTLTHNDTTYMEGEKEEEEVELPQFEVTYKTFVCYFCHAGFQLRDNLFLHLMRLHYIEYDFVFTVVVSFKMLFAKKVYSCQKCPKTFDSTDMFAGHTSSVCQHFLDNYHAYTWCCKKCVTDTSSTNATNSANNAITRTNNSTHNTTNVTPNSTSSSSQASRNTTYTDPRVPFKAKASDIRRSPKKNQQVDQEHLYCVDLRCPLVMDQSKYDAVIHHGKILTHIRDWNINNGCHDHSCSSPFQCTVCVGKFTSFKALTIHFLAHHKDSYFDVPPVSFKSPTSELSSVSRDK